MHEKLKSETPHSAKEKKVKFLTFSSSLLVRGGDLRNGFLLGWDHVSILNINFFVLVQFNMQFIYKNEHYFEKCRSILRV